MVWEDIYPEVVEGIGRQLKTQGDAIQNVITAVDQLVTTATTNATQQRQTPAR